MSNEEFGRMYQEFLVQQQMNNAGCGPMVIAAVVLVVILIL